MTFHRRLLSLLTILATLCCQVAFANPEFSQAYKAAQSGNYNKAITIWKPLAEQGIPAAQYALGWLYESGQGTAQNDQQAAYWYEKAAQQGDIAAQYVLATMYSSGIGVNLDQQLAVKWFLKAANQGDAIAQFKLGKHFQLGEGVEKSDSDSFLWFSKAAKQGHITAQINLGKIYQEGRGVPRNYKLAMQWYEQAANQGDALGQYQLASMYEYGRGTAQDYKQAEALYLQSSEHYAPAAFKIAEFSEQGKTGEINFNNALKWYKKAANKGNSAAQFKIAVMYQKGMGVAQNIQTAISWFYNAAQQDYAPAAYQLGAIYESGITDNNAKQIITQDYYKAAQYYTKASKLDYNLAHERLAYLYENGFGVPVDLKQALSLYQLSNQASAKTRFDALAKQINCRETATTTLFSVSIACTNRKELSQQIKAQKIHTIAAKSNTWTDTYFTGAAIRGSSELEINYTKEALFARAQYTFVGRDNPQLISRLKVLLSDKYGEPDKQIGDPEYGVASFAWLLDDGIELTVNRGWPNTTTFVTYSSPEHLFLLKQQQQQNQHVNQIQTKQNNGLNLF